MAKHRERKSTNTLGARVIIATIRNAIDTLRGKVERDPIAARSSRGWGVRDVDVEAEVDPVPEDPKTMGGPIAQDLLPLPRHGVFSVREPRSTCRNPGKGRMSTRLLSARFSAHADPDSVWTSSRAPPLRPAASLPSLRIPLLLHVDLLSRSRSIPTSRQVPRSRSQESFDEGHARCND